MPTNFQEAITRGMAWLDEQHPGWERKIDLEKLNLIECRSCVLGQLTGDYFMELYRLFPDRDDDPDQWAKEHGFSAGPPGTGREYYPPLTLAWKAAITQRLATKGNNS